MTGKDWTTQLRQRLADYEAPAPEGLWNDIEAALGQPAAPAAGQKARRTGLRRWAAAAAVAALIGGGAYLAWHTEQAQQPAELTQRVAEPAKQHPDTPPATEQPHSATPLLTQRATGSQTTVAPSRDDNAATPTAATPDSERTAADSPNGSTQPQPPTQRETLPPSTTPGYAKHDTQYTKHNASNARRKAPHPALSLYAMGGGNAQNSTNGVLMSPVLANYYSSIANTPNASRSEKQKPIYLSDYEERQHHDQPLSLGLTVSLPVSSRLALVTGLAYTRLHAEFTNIMSANSISKEQTLHYVGIPLSAQYHFWRTRWLQAYASAGMQIDKNISAKVATDGSAQTTDLDRLQWSAQGAVGVQLNMMPQLSLYAEPGVKYYFDNGSHLQNYFKDKPLEFNLQFGLRLNIKP